MWNVAYNLHNKVIFVESIEARTVREACEQGWALCYFTHPEGARESFEFAVAESGMILEPVNLHWNDQLRCFSCLLARAN